VGLPVGDGRITAAEPLLLVTGASTGGKAT
jgi:hypothetical protein